MPEVPNLSMALNYKRGCFVYLRKILTSIELALRLGSKMLRSQIKNIRITFESSCMILIFLAERLQLSKETLDG